MKWSYELKRELKARDLATSGNKRDLINRLQNALKNPGSLNEDGIRIQAGEFDSDH